MQLGTPGMGLAETVAQTRAALAMTVADVGDATGQRALDEALLGLVGLARGAAGAPSYAARPTPGAPRGTSDRLLDGDPASCSAAAADLYAEARRLRTAVPSPVQGGEPDDTRATAPDPGPTVVTDLAAALDDLATALQRYAADLTAARRAVREAEERGSVTDGYAAKAAAGRARARLVRRCQEITRTATDAALRSSPDPP